MAGRNGERPVCSTNHHHLPSLIVYLSSPASLHTLAKVAPFGASLDRQPSPHVVIELPTSATAFLVSHLAALDVLVPPSALREHLESRIPPPKDVTHEAARYPRTNSNTGQPPHTRSRQQRRHIAPRHCTNPPIFPLSTEQQVMVAGC